MTGYKYLLFDLDDTLLDFSKAESVSFRAAQKEIGLDLPEEALLEYKRINEKLWKMLEKKEITLEKLKTERFKLVLASSGHPEGPDHHPLAEKMRDAYMENLAICGFPITGAREALEKLKEKYKIYVITNGIDWIQKKRIEMSGLQDLFDGIFVSEAAGTSKPDPGFFDYVVKHVGDDDRSSYVVIGDSLTSDCDGAMGAHMDFIWHARHGSEPDPDGKFGKRIIKAAYCCIDRLPDILESLQSAETWEARFD